MVIDFFVNGFIKMTPTIITNFSPVLTAKLLPSLNYPVDFNQEYKGKRVFGSHKTWRGVITMLLTSLLTGYLLLNLNYGLLIGLGVITGDLLTSFLKRRANLAPGKSFQPYDSEILVLCVVIFSPGLFNVLEVFFIIVLAPIIYKAFNYLSYKIKLQSHPW